VDIEAEEGSDTNGDRGSWLSSKVLDNFLHEFMQFK
jgi:hypothetical protein